MGKCLRCGISITKRRARICRSCRLNKKSKPIENEKKQDTVMNEKKDNSSFSEDIHLFDEALKNLALDSSDEDKVKKLKNITASNLERKEEYMGDFTSSYEENCYNLDTQDYETIDDYNMDKETYSDFESLNDSHNSNNNSYNENNDNNSLNIEISESFESSSSSSKNEEESKNSSESVCSVLSFDSVPLAVKQIELDSLFIKLQPNSFDNVINFNSGFPILNHITLYNRNTFFTSDTFKKINFKPCSIGYLYILNYRVKLLLWYKDEFYILYDKILQAILKSIRKLIKESNYNYDIVQKQKNILSRLPPFINPNGKSITIYGHETVTLLLANLCKETQAAFYIRGSKTPITNQCEDIHKFNEFLHSIIISNNIDKFYYQNTTNIHNYYIDLDKIYNRIDWSYNFYDNVYDSFISNDMNFIIEYIEEYFNDAMDIQLQVKNIVTFEYQYFLKDSISFRGDIYDENSNKLGQIITYYHNSILYRNENIGSTRSSPISLTSNYSNILYKNSTYNDIIFSYSYFKDILKNGLVKRIEIRSFSFNEITVQFPILLQKLSSELSNTFNVRQTNGLNDKKNESLKSIKKVAKNSSMPVYLSKNNTYLFYGLFKDNELHHNFNFKIESLLNIIEQVITHDNMDILLFIIIDEMLFTAFNGLRNKGFKYAFSNEMLLKFFNAIHDIKQNDNDLFKNIKKKLKYVFLTETAKRIDFIPEINDDESIVYLNSIIDYEIITMNFYYKEVYKIENIFRILSVLFDSKRYLLRKLFIKENNFEYTFSLSNLYENTVKDIIRKILVPQLLCDFYELFHKSKYKNFFRRHEWVQCTINFTDIYKFKGSYKKFEEIDQINIIKDAFFKKKLENIPYNHLIRQRNRNENYTSIELDKWVKDLFNYLTGKSKTEFNVVKDNSDSSFLSSKMITQIILYYINIFFININIKKEIYLILKEFEEAERQKNSFAEFTMIVPTFVNGKIFTSHTQNVNAYMWISVIEPKIQNTSHQNNKELKKKVCLKSGGLKKLSELAEEEEKKEKLMRKRSKVYFKEINMINFISSKLSFDSSFKFKIFLKKQIIEFEDYRELVFQNSFSTHLLSYWDIIIENRKILLQNNFIKFCEKTPNFIFISKGITKLKIYKSLFYVFYISTLILCTSSGSLTKNISKKEIIQTLPFLDTNTAARAPMKINKEQFIEFCNNLDI